MVVHSGDMFDLDELTWMKVWRELQMPNVPNPNDHCSARTSMPKAEIDLRQITPDPGNGLMCVTQLRPAKAFQSFPFFLQLPEDLEGFEQAYAGSFSMELFRTESCIEPAVCWQQFCNLPFLHRSFSAWPPDDQLEISVLLNEERNTFSIAWQCARTGASDEEPEAIRSLRKLSGKYADAASQILFQALKESKRRINTKLADDDNALLYLRVLSDRIRVSMQMPTTSRIKTVIKEKLPSVLTAGDFVSMGCEVRPFSYHHDREIAMGIAEDWSLNCSGGYSESANPLIRPKRKFDRYGWIQPIFHLTSDPADFDSGVRLDAVHRKCGSFLELHSFEGTDAVMESAEVFKRAIPSFDMNLDWWQGRSEYRWLD